MKPALQVVETRAMRVPYKAVQIVQARLGVDAGLIGAGALIYFRKEEEGVSQPVEIMVGVA